MTKSKLLQGSGIVLSLVLLVWQLVPAPKKEALPSRPLTVDWFGVKVSVTEMDEQGKPKRAFSADRLVHYQAENMTDMFEPRFTLIPDTKIPWHLSAGMGRTYHGAHTTDISRVDLWETVTVWQPREATPTPMKMITSKLSVFPETATAETDQHVDFEQPGHKISGTGLRANFNERSMELLDKVRSEHVRQSML